MSALLRDAPSPPCTVFLPSQRPPSLALLPHPHPDTLATSCPAQPHTTNHGLTSTACMVHPALAPHKTKSLLPLPLQSLPTRAALRSTPHWSSCLSPQSSALAGAACSGTAHATLRAHQMLAPQMLGWAVPSGGSGGLTGHACTHRGCPLDHLQCLHSPTVAAAAKMSGRGGGNKRKAEGGGRGGGKKKYISRAVSHSMRTAMATEELPASGMCGAHSLGTLPAPAGGL